jgi:IS30 family transposase
VSHKTIYRWIWDFKKSKKKTDSEYSKLYKNLRHGSRRQKRGNIKDKRGAIKDHVGIGESPSVVEQRERIGDIEVDLMMGSQHKSAPLVMTDRATLVTMLEKFSGKNAS